MFVCRGMIGKMKLLRRFKSPSLVSSCQQLMPDRMNDFSFVQARIVCSCLHGLSVYLFDLVGLSWYMIDVKRKHTCGCFMKTSFVLFVSHTWHNPWFLSLCICKNYLFKTSKLVVGWRWMLNMARLLQARSINWRHWYIPVQLNKEKESTGIFMYMEANDTKWRRQSCTLGVNMLTANNSSSPECI